MKKIVFSYMALPLMLVSVSAAAVTPLPSAPIKVLAAGSLTGAMTAVAQLYTQQTGQKIDAQFGPAGLLRERIESGEQADIFASANMEHPQALADQGIATPAVVMVRNRLCAKALPDYKLTTENLLDRLLDPQVGLGTSTPKADPGGDYAWQMFAKAEKVRPGAQAILEAKAQQLVGGKNNPPVPAGRNAMEYFFAEKKVQISLGYCSGRQTTPDPKFASVPLPAALAITPSYGLSVITREKKSHEAAYRFALFLLSPQAQKLMAQYGFTPVTVPAED
ncbi:molybdate ABC transporter substrate-binding protein [Herminiimonas arsenitoxidans]|uniref:molybdate ABC transporter substrate-binding protein n=1 Tax=Herminiimonas arsenitoxidans TaxID=1809410 RepID=UPI0012FF8489|nr:molybdate ABC transporter substrate-binding protein [Herminiimonas arsenitoxidans]